MVLSVTSFASTVGARLVEQTVTNATANNNVIGTAGSLFTLDVDNTAVGATTYLKFWDVATPTVGTSVPYMQIPIASGVRRVFAIPQGIAFATAISFAATVNAIYTDATNPSGNVIVRLVTS